MEFVKLIPINRICPCCGNGNYMRIISGKYVGELNVKCINCNSYYNYDELLKRDNSKPLNGADGRTMDDLISRAELLKECAERQKTDPRFEGRGWASHFISDAGEPSTEWYCVEYMIENVPSVDAVPVVRCRDCKHRPIDNRDKDGDVTGFAIEFPDSRCPCQCEDGWYNWYPNDDWYCASGERRESE